MSDQEKLVVNLENYVELAGRTNKDYSGGFTLTGEQTWVIPIIAQEVIRLSHLADTLKRAVFYGKELNPWLLLSRLGDVSITVPPTQPSLTVTKEQIDLLHAAMGCVTEAGEVLQTVVDHVFQGKPLDAVNLKEEVGDLEWYQALALKTIGCSLQEALQANINKLRARYGEKFSQEKALNRDLDKEREVLETFDKVGASPEYQEAAKAMGLCTGETKPLSLRDQILKDYVESTTAEGVGDKMFVESVDRIMAGETEP